MLGIDIALQHLDEALEINGNLTTLSIDFLNLQTAHISLKEASKPSLPASAESRQKCISTLATKSGRGAFSIIDRSEHFLKTVCESVLSVDAILLARNDQKEIYEYAGGAVEGFFFNHCSAPSDDHLHKKSFRDMKVDARLSEKFEVYGKPAIIAYFPSIIVNFVHSVGVGSIAGSVTISITVIDLAKVSFKKIIGATGRIIQEPPSKLMINRAALIRDRVPFIAIKDTSDQKLECPTVPRLTFKNTPSRTSRYESKRTEKLHEESSIDSLSLLDGKINYLNYDSDDSVSIDGFFEAINAKRNQSQSKDENENENEDDNCDENENKNDNESDIPLKNKKIIPTQKIRKNYDSDIKTKNMKVESKPAYTKNSVRAPGKENTMKPYKDWDSAPMGRVDYSKKIVTKVSNSVDNENENENEKNQKKHSIKGSKTNVRKSSLTSSYSLSVDDIDKELQHASSQIFNNFKCSIKVTDSFIDFEKAKEYSFIHKDMAHVMS